MRFLNTILNIIFPVNCISCGKNGSELCLDCLSKCPDAERESAKWIFPIYDYRHPHIKKAIWFLKYKNKRNFARIFAEILYGRIIEELSDLMLFNNFQKPILIPIPLSRKRNRERGYNQSTLICKELIRIDEKNYKNTNMNFSLYTNILIKTKNGKHQAQIENRRGRLKNIINSFKVIDKDFIKGKNIILIDDVTTTGATLNEAKKTLKESGARKIIAFTVAH